MAMVEYGTEFAPLVAFRLPAERTTQPPRTRTVDILANLAGADDRWPLITQCVYLVLYHKCVALANDYCPPSTGAPPIQFATSETVIISIRPISIIKPTA